MPDSTFGGLPPEIQQQIALTCASKACKDAQDQLIKARNAVITACSDVKRFESDRTTFLAVTTALGAAAITLWVAGATTIWPVNLICFIVAAALTIAALVFAGLAADAIAKLGKARAALSAAEQMFTDAVDAVIKACNNYCYPDMTVPACP